MEELLVIVALICKPAVRVDYTATSTYIQINNVEDSYQCEEITRQVTDVTPAYEGVPTQIVWDDYYQEWRYEEVPKPTAISDNTDGITWTKVPIIDGSEWATKPANQYTIHEVSYEQLRQDDIGGNGRTRR